MSRCDFSLLCLSQPENGRHGELEERFLRVLSFSRVDSTESPLLSPSSNSGGSRRAQRKTGKSLFCPLHIVMIFLLLLLCISAPLFLPLSLLICRPPTFSWHLSLLPSIFSQGIVSLCCETIITEPFLNSHSLAQTLEPDSAQPSSVRLIHQQSPCRDKEVDLDGES